VRGLPVVDSTASGVYCSHVLEHLDRVSAVVALKNTLAMFEPGGTFRLVVPDLEWRARRFLDDVDRGRRDAAERFMVAAHLGQVAPMRTLLARAKAVLGNSAHRWMYNFPAMADALDESGFSSIRRAAFGDAKDPMFARVEDIGRFIDDGHAECAIEARR
jgi:predicted SAM-dependent methyltransferase